MSRPSASARMRRMLALIPWVAAHDGPSVEEVCRRFTLSREDLAADLQVIFLVGTPPYTPDRLIEAVIEDERVWIRFADMFARPLRLTPEEGLALVAAGQAILATPGADPSGALARGLAKVAAVLGVDPDTAMDVDFGAVPDAAFDRLRTAVADHRAVRLDYYSASRDERTERVVEPWSLWTYQGNWYLRGHCRTAEGERIFRVDRIAEVTTLDDTFTPPPATGELGARPSGDLPTVVLDLAPEGRWAVETHPPEATEERPGGRLRATFGVASEAWLTRLLLQLGPNAKVVGSGHEARAARAAVRSTAGALLDRYR